MRGKNNLLRSSKRDCTAKGRAAGAISWLRSMARREPERLRLRRVRVRHAKVCVILCDGAPMLRVSGSPNRADLPCADRNINGQKELWRRVGRASLPDGRRDLRGGLEDGHRGVAVWRINKAPPSRHPDAPHTTTHLPIVTLPFGGSTRPVAASCGMGGCQGHSLGAEDAIVSAVRGPGPRSDRKESEEIKLIL
jgi:hypothetical protein